jgi:hypothetical protein
MGTLPPGTSALLPAGGGGGGGNNCCGGVNNKCTADPSAFRADPIWSALEFDIDTPSNYQYQYSSTPDGATVKASSDTDCDGISATWTLEITKTSTGDLRTTIVEPPRGVY